MTKFYATHHAVMSRYDNMSLHKGYVTQFWKFQSLKESINFSELLSSRIEICLSGHAGLCSVHTHCEAMVQLACTIIGLISLDTNLNEWQLCPAVLLSNLLYR